MTAPESFDDVTRTIAEQIIKHDYASVVSHFDDKMKRALPTDKLGAAWEPLAKEAGSFQRLGAPTDEDTQGFHVVILPLIHEKATWNLRLAFDGQKRIAGLFFKPGESPEFESVTREIAEAIVRKDVAAVVARFDATMKAALSADQLRTTLATVAEPSDKFVKLGPLTPMGTALGVHVLVVPLIYEKTRWKLQVALNDKKQIAGLFITPAETAPWTPPSYGQIKTTERQVKVGPLGLDGTLVQPQGTGPFPLAVLVQGSGPHDQDETIGPNKPMRDLALGLAAKGIASLRYDKRTHAHGPEFTVDKKYTAKEETVEDAVAAVHLAAGTVGIDPKRVWVIGHSLGGYLAPRVAAQSAETRGLVILAGPTRPLEELILEQTKYLAKNEPTAVAKAMAVVAAVRDPHLTDAQAVDFMGPKIPGSYFLDLRGYEPAKIAAALKRPILVLQGERDYQVRRADYDGWSKVLAAASNVKMKLYPTLNHLFEAGQGESRPDEYWRPGLHVAPEVVDDIAAFIHSMK